MITLYHKVKCFYQNKKNIAKCYDMSIDYKKFLKMTAVIKQHSKHINKIGNNKNVYL